MPEQKIIWPLALFFLLGACQYAGRAPLPEGIQDPPGISVDVEQDTVCFAVIGDYGWMGEDEEDVAALVKGWEPDFILTTGDNNYEYGEYATLSQNIGQFYCDYIYNFDAPAQYRCEGRAFEDSLNRFFPSPGNHDEKGPYDLEPYLNYFSLPGEEEFYTFTWGPVALYSISSLSSADFEKQKGWLVEELGKSKKAFQIVYFHHAPFSPGRHGDTERMQWDFHQWGADVVVTGHDHIYARLTHHGQGGLPYIVNGVGGKSLYYCDEDYNTEGVEVLSCEDEYYGAIRCWADSTRMILEFYSIDYPKEPLDRLEIIREYP
jgi:hypothetical protein